MMETIIWRGRQAATVDGEETQLADHIAVLECDHPDRRFVCAMCVYAYEIQTGVIPGHYDQDNAERYARTFLAPDWAFSAPNWPDAAIAELYAIPLDQVQEGRREWLDEGW